MALLSSEEIRTELGEVDGWSLEGDAITKEFDRDNFVGSVALVNAIEPVAEELSHHPDLNISWATVTVTVTSHSEGGLTATDFELARKIDEVA